MAAIAFCREVGFKSIAVGAVGGSWTWGVIKFDSHATGQAQIHQLSGIPPAAQILGGAGFPIVDLTLSTPGVAITVAREDDAPPAKRVRVAPPAPLSPKMDLRAHVPRSREQSVHVLAVVEQGALEQSAPVTQAVVPALQATVPTAEAYPQPPQTTYKSQNPSKRP
jgi:hypothetical protein